MAVFTQRSVRDNIRVRDGCRVFYLADGDHLTPSAEEWLKQENVQILPASQAKPQFFKTPDGAMFAQKPEHMTHLYADVLVKKDHPRIKFRGMVDALEAELLLVICHGQQPYTQALEEILAAVRKLIAGDVMNEPVKQDSLCGLSMEQIRTHSHFPQRYYDQPHFMPSSEDSEFLLRLNKIRTMIRQTELSAYSAFHDADGCVTRPDILQMLNRLSSMIWILMIRRKKEEDHDHQKEPDT